MVAEAEAVVYAVFSSDEGVGGGVLAAAIEEFEFFVFV